MFTEKRNLLVVPRKEDDVEAALLEAVDRERGLGLHRVRHAHNPHQLTLHSWYRKIKK